MFYPDQFVRAGRRSSCRGAVVLTYKERAVRAEDVLRYIVECVDRGIYDARAFAWHARVALEAHDEQICDCDRCAGARGLAFVRRPWPADRGKKTTDTQFSSSEEK